MAVHPPIPANAVRHEDGQAVPTRDALAVESLLQIKLNGEPWLTTVQTPGDEHDLVRGLLYTEGMIGHDASLGLRNITDPETGLAACVEVHVDAALLKRSASARANAASASCGFCGVRDAQDLQLHGVTGLSEVAAAYAPEDLAAMFAEFGAGQRLFAASGGVHGAALFDAAATRLALAEDIGRHNAVDKCIGRLLAEGALERAKCLVVSGRLSYEIVFKAVQARIPVVAAVSAPSSLAVETARAFGVTLAAFCRPPRCTVYSHGHRIRPPREAGANPMES